MSYKQTVEDNLQHFAKSIGLGELKLSDQNACGLCFDETLTVNIEYLENDEALVFVSSIKTIDVHNEQKTLLFDKLLSFNLQHNNMQGAYTSLNADQSEILLIRSTLASNDYGNFETSLEKFVNTLEWLTMEIENINNSSTSTPTNTTETHHPNSPNMGMMV